MRFNLDKSFGVPEAALHLRAQRTRLIADNLANSDTPNYKARDFDFRSAMQQAQGQLAPLRTTQPNHLQPAAGDPRNPDVRYRVPFNAAVDGNTVETHAEQAKFAENTIHYQATLTVLGARIQGLMGALRGE